MDGCFGLYRKRAKGASLLGTSRHADLMFADQDVDNFVDNYGRYGTAKVEEV